MLLKAMAELAKRHPTTKFIQGVSTKIIENFKEHDCPGLFFYKNGELTGNIIPARQVLGGTRMTAETVEYVLSLNKMLEIEAPEQDPRDKLKLINTTIVKGKNAGRHHEDDVDSEGEDDREYVSNQYQRY